jgi:uncharacterized membrane protein YeaQ/YmgE (transglycosylase-associated protein family)
MLTVLGALGFGNLVLDPGNIIGWVIAALLAGWLAGKLVRGHGYGCLGDIVLGLIGAVVGLVILSVVPLHFTGTLGFLGTLVVAFLGSLLLALIGRLIGGGHSRTAQVQRPPRRNGP